MVVSAVELNMKTVKKKITLTLTAKEAEWLRDIVLGNIVRNAENTPRQQDAKFMAASLQDRINSES